MNILSSASFGNSGSGVITDYLLEFGNIFNPGDYEFRFFQDYGGITTLEDCLVHNYHRLNSDIAIQIFIKYIKYQSGDIFSKRYEKYFKGRFKKLSYKFINKLIDVQWKGYWEEYQVLAPNNFINSLKYKIYPRVLRMLYGNKHYIARYIPCRDMYFSSPTPEYFVQCVKEYFNDLCCVIDPEGKYKFLYFDQLLPPTNIERYFKYFDSLHVIVVDRDPRDYYIDTVLNYGEKWVPADIDKFVLLYKNMRKNIDIKNENINVLRLQFEDTIYKYEEFKIKVNTFLGLSELDHVYPRSKFDPSISIKNTRLWEKMGASQDAIKKIEDNLGQYCYKF
jgi:hypothetical protein